MRETFKILVPTDFSACAGAALARALDVAGRYGGEVTLLYVLDTSGLAHHAGDAAASAAELFNHLHASASRELRKAADGADPGRRVIVRDGVEEGRPAETIVERARAEGADMIVMGTRGQGGPDGLGSVAERVARLAPCDVLIAHAPRPVAGKA